MASNLPTDIDTLPPAAVLAWLETTGMCVSVRADRLLLMDLRPLADPPPQHAAVAAVKLRKTDLLAFLRAEHHPAPAVTPVAADQVPELAATLAKATRIGVESAVTGFGDAHPTPYRCRPTRLALAPDPATVFLIDPRSANVLPLRDALAKTELVGWDATCTRLGLMGLLLVSSHRTIVGLVPGAGHVIGEDESTALLAARRAAALTNLTTGIPVPTHVAYHPVSTE